MKKNIRVAALVMSIFLVVTLLAACGDKADQDGPKGASQNNEPKELTVWTHLTEKSEYPVVKKIAEEWAEKTGNKVKVVYDQSSFQAYSQAAASSKGPDIMFGMPHNDLGVFQRANLLEEVPSDVIDKSKYVDVAIDAVTHNGKIYALPLAMDSMALFYNPEKVTTPPATFEEFIEQAKKVGFMYHFPDLFSSYPFIAGSGAYVFKNNSGTLDVNDIGLGNEGAVKGYALIRSFIKEHNFFKADCTGDIANGNFKAGKIGFFLGGPWDVDGFRKANVKFAVTPLPKMDGKIMPTFVSLQAAFVSAKSKNKETAWELMKYMAENSPVPLFKSGNRIPVLKAELEKPEVKGDKIISAFAEQASNGNPIPNIPEMNAAWDPVKNNILLVVSDKSTPEKAGVDVVTQIKQGISTLQSK
ncbi:MAG: maltose ABC transporter substrate-binding protein [Clostridia bacterium]|nr:maltose ABC transporter substrate-binding protein [Clostridia bacterium]